MRVKEVGEAIMNFDLSKLEQPFTVILYTYAGVLLLILVCSIIAIIYFIRGLK
jgi:hypothetical protein